jgi:hypothetical protein
MRVGILGSKDWENYSEVIRSLTVFIQEAHELGHDELILVHTGSKGAENMITEYVGKTKKFLREKGFKIKEEVAARNSQIIKDMSVIDSDLQYALLFSTGDKRTISFKKILKEYGIPFRIIELDK